MSIGSSKLTSLIAIALVSPMLLFFQNCGSNSGYSQENSKERSAREAYQVKNGGYSAAGAGGGGSGSGGSGGGTFTIGGGSNGGGSSGGGGTSGGSSNGGSNGNYPPGFVMPEIKSDGTNCYSGEFGVDASAYNMIGNETSIMRLVPFVEIRNVNTAATKMNFPDAYHGDTHMVSCAVAFDKMKKYFPQIYFSSGYTCVGNESKSTLLQCRSGQWFFASTACECKRIIQDIGGRN